MAWRCGKCGATNDDGGSSSVGLLSGQSQKFCTFCATKGVELKETEIIKFCKTLAGKLNCEFLLEIDQTYHPKIKEQAQGPLKDSDSGICAIMTARWISIEKGPVSPQNKFDAFKDVMNTGVPEMVVEQTVYMKEQDSRNKLFAEKEDAVNAYKELTGGLASPPPGAAKNITDAWDKAKLFVDTIDAAHIAERRRQGGGNDGTVAFDDEKLGTVKDNIVNLLKKGGLGCFAISFGPNDGHIIGIKLTNSVCQLMDANTGLWECTPVTLNVLFKELVNKYYSSYSTLEGVYYG